MTLPFWPFMRQNHFAIGNSHLDCFQEMVTTDYFATLWNLPPPNQLTSHFGNIRLCDCGWMEWIKFQSIQSENGFILVKYLISLHNASVDRIKSFDTNFRYPQFSNSISHSLNANFHSKFMFFMEIPRMDIQIFISFRILKMIYRKFDLQNTNDVWEIPNFCTNSHFFDEFRFIWSD